MNKKGFTLIEVLIALVILAIGLLAVAGMQITAIKGNFFSSSLTQATVLSQDKMEWLKNITYANVSSGSDTICSDYSTPPCVNSTSFTRVWNVAEDAGNSIKTITVTVQWQDRIDHSIKLSTIRAK